MHPRAILTLLSLALLLGSAAAFAQGEASSPGLAAERAILDQLLADRDARAELARERDAATGERRDVIEEQIWQSRLESQERMRELAEGLASQQDEGTDVEPVRARLTAAIREEWPRLRERLLDLEDRLEEIQTARESASGEERTRLDRELHDLEQRVGDSYRLLAEALAFLAPAGVALEEERAFVSGQITDWADLLSARVQLLTRQRDDAAERASADATDETAKAELAALEARMDDTLAALSLASDLLGTLEIPNSQYRQTIIGATGEITRDILDRDVALGLLRRISDRAVDAFASGAPAWLFKTLIFALILIAFRAAAGLVRRVVEQSLRSSNLKLSQLLQETLTAWSSRIVMLVGLLVAVSQLGFEIGALLAGLGIAGFVLGFALQDSLSNFAAGAMILIYRPFDVGDIVEAAGVTGSVSRMTLVSTTILTFDNQTLIVPNSKIWGDVIRNVTAQQIRRVDLVFGIGYGDDVDRADAVLRSILEQNDKVLDEPVPTVEVHELGDSSVNFVVRPWVRTEDYWAVHWAVTREVKKRFDREGITIPFPQRDVHHYFETPMRPASDG